MLDVKNVDEKSIMKDIDRARQNRLWLSKSIETLKGKYVDIFVAVDGGKIVGTNETFEGLVSSLKKRYTDISYIAIEYIPEEDYIVVV